MLYEQAYAFLASIASGKDTEKGNNWMMLYEPHFSLTLYLRPCDAASRTISYNYSLRSCIRPVPGNVRAGLLVMAGQLWLSLALRL